MASVEDVFQESPSEELLYLYTKEHLLQIAEFYKLEITSKDFKGNFAECTKK